MYTKNDFGKELNAEINNYFNMVCILKLAYEKYLDHAANDDKEIYNAIMSVTAMQEGSEFDQKKRDS